MFLHLFITDSLANVTSVCRLGRVLRVDVEVGEQHRLGEGRLVVDPAAAITVGTSSWIYGRKLASMHQIQFDLPVLKKKEQFTLSFSVPKILARYSAIFIANLKIENTLEPSD